MSSNAEAHRSKIRKETGQHRRVLEIAKELTATLGTDFFQSIVKHLATAFRADCVYLAELAGTPPDRIKTLAVFRGAEASENFEQHLAGAAASQVLSDGAFARNRDVRSLFPLDSLLDTAEAEAYIGVRLSDSAGQPVGIVAMVSKEGFANLHLVKSVLEAFVPRAAAELERKRSEDVHRENEERYQAFISSNPDAMWRVEFQQPIPLGLTEKQLIESIYNLGYLAECNHALARMAGADSVDELLGSRFDEIATRINPDIRKELRRAIRSGFRAAAIETTPIDSAGQQTWRLRTEFGIVEDGRLLRIWGTTRDVTDLRKTQLSLVAAERRFREVLEGVELAAVMLDLDGKIAFANECFLRLAQRSRADLSERTWLTGIIPERDSQALRALLTDEHDRPAAVHFEGSLIARDGSVRAIAWDTIALYDNANRPGGVAAIGRDMTRQWALEAEIRQTQKLDGIGRLAAGVAHDFNNLLTVILGHAGQLLARVPASDPARDRLTAIENAATRCGHLTAQLLAFGGRQRMQPKLINLNEVITGDEGIIRDLITGDIKLIIDLQSPLGLVYADPTQIQRVLANLVTNARDAMATGGELIVATSNLTTTADEEMYPGIKAGAYVRLSITDTGVGLTDDIRAHMFEPFFTTKAPGRGTGLGLATVYGIVTQCGGHIMVNSEPGRGTRFDILLPAASQ